MLSLCVGYRLKAAAQDGRVVLMHELAVRLTMDVILQVRRLGLHIHGKHFVSAVRPHFLTNSRASSALL
jgi:hypothetical protein